MAILRSSAEQATLDSIRALLTSPAPPDAIFTASFFRFFPALKVLDELQLWHPADVFLAGFDQAMDDWDQDTVRRVVREPLGTVLQRADEIGRTAVELALTAIDGQNVLEEERLIRPLLNW